MRLFSRDPKPAFPPPAKAAAPRPAQVMVGRQPIFDRHRRVFGYELLFRPSALDAAEMTKDEGVARVITEGVMTLGLNRLTSGKRAFIEMTPAFLTHDVVKALPPAGVVLQVPGDADLTAATVEACRGLKEAGYLLALNRFTPSDAAFAMLPLVDFVKTDFLSTDAQAGRAAIQASRVKPALVATKVEAPEIFNRAVSEGYSHVQGFFFERPNVTDVRPIPRGQVGYLRLLQALNDPNLSLASLEDLIKHDASLCFRLLQTVNSAAYAQTREVTTLRHALLLVGRDTMRRWASLWIMAGFGSDQHQELVQMASIRGRLCEILMAHQAGPDAEGEGFLLGMCSCLDAILEQPMSAVLEQLPLSPQLAAALLGAENPARNLLDTVMAYERGDWDMCLRLAAVANIQPDWLPTAHADALGWAEQLMRPAARKTA